MRAGTHFWSMTPIRPETVVQIVRPKSHQPNWPCGIRKPMWTSTMTAAIMSIRARGGIVIVIAHRPSALAGVDLVLVMGEGRVQSFGPKEEVLSKVLRPVPASQAPEPRVASVAPLKVV